MGSHGDTQFRCDQVFNIEKLLNPGFEIIGRLQITGMDDRNIDLFDHQPAA